MAALPPTQPFNCLAFCSACNLRNLCPFRLQRSHNVGHSGTGVWVDEFAAMGLDDCLDHIWNRAEVFLNNKDEDKKCALTLALAVSTSSVV